MINKWKSTYQAFNSKFWILVLTTFVDSVGGTMIFPFFSLYITQKFDVGMTEAGLLLGTFSISGFIGSMIGGALTDKFGRKKMVIFGLVFSACSSVAMGLLNNYAWFYVLSVIVGLLSNIAGPARQAMVADLLPEEKRAEGFGILRVSANLAWIIGPTIGGIVSLYSYLALFIADAVTSLIVAVIFFRLIPETMPQASESEEKESLLQTFAGYITVTKDKIFLFFVLAVMIGIFAYQQIYNTLSVFLRDVHSVDGSGFGFLMSANAFVVVLLQFWVTKQTSKIKPMYAMAFGTVFYLIGFLIYGAAAEYWLFFLAMMAITVGEMITVPVSDSLAASFAPESMRGRYMAFFSLNWVIPQAFGPSLAGIILDNYNPYLLWYLCAACCAVSILALLLIHKPSQKRLQKLVPEAE